MHAAQREQCKVDNLVLGRGDWSVNPSEQQNSPERRVRADLSILGTTQMHLRSPLIIAIWSGIFPGLGHLLLSKYIRGFILFGWEILINLESHLNQSIYYSFIGNFDMAKQVLNNRWFLLYIPTFLFAVWDSYRTTVDLNNQFILAAREDAAVKVFVAHPLEINYLDKSSPWVAVAWSIISPGTGQLILHRIVVAFFLLIWWIVVAYFSRLLPAIQYTMLGQFSDARAVLDPQWALNIPSLYFFALYDAYVNTVCSNKLFDWEQAKFLKRDYQSRLFPMPFRGKLKRGDQMYIVSTFEHDIRLETAITAIEMQGIPKADILAVSMDKKNEDRVLFDRIHYSDGVSMLDLPVIMATVFSLFGFIYGFILHWGPVIWAIIGTAFGFGAGLLIKLYTTRKQKERKMAEAPGVVLLIACKESQMDMVQETLWANYAIGVSKLSLGADS